MDRVDTPARSTAQLDDYARRHSSAKAEDYGLLAIATGLLALLTIINEMGLEAALVQRKILNEELPEKYSAWCS